MEPPDKAPSPTSPVQEPGTSDTDSATWDKLIPQELSPHGVEQVILIRPSGIVRVRGFGFRDLGILVMKTNGFVNPSIQQTTAKLFSASL